ncbi:MAG: DUF4349 domain-containing protein [Ruminococcaceae bacterium]|nr:DUF4349 domain-containing protein [Oscillospiraceae bacterium]
MKRTKITGRIISALLITLALLLTMIGCSKGGAYDSGMNSSLAEKPTIGDPGHSGGSSDSGGIGKLPEDGSDSPSDKIIKTVTTSMSTTEYDSLVEKLYEAIKAVGGYTDNERISGSTPYRTANITIRIPAEKLEEFKSVLSGLGNVTYYNASKVDVSLTYSTLKARVDTLTTEIGVIEELFEIAKADGDISRISELERRLTDIKMQKAEAEAQLAVYDNSIAYSTVNLEINEVREYVAPEPEPELNAFQRIGKDFVRNLKNVGNFFVEFFVWFVGSLPILVIWAGVLTGIFFLVRFLRRRYPHRFPGTKNKRRGAEKASDTDTDSTLDNDTDTSKNDE